MVSDKLVSKEKTKLHALARLQIVFSSIPVHLYLTHAHVHILIKRVRVSLQRITKLVLSHARVDIHET